LECGAVKVPENAHEPPHFPPQFMAKEYFGFMKERSVDINKSVERNKRLFIFTQGN
jgi:hypothetical protein